MKHAEAASAMFGHIGSIKGTTKAGSVKSVSIPIDPKEPTGPCETIYDHDTMGLKLLERNKTHFGQSNGTDFTQPQVVEALGQHGERGKAGLEKLKTDGLSETTGQLIEQLLSFWIKEIQTMLEEEEVVG